MAELCNRTEALFRLRRMAEDRAQDRPFVIAIDGRAASGKTSFAGLLSKHIDAHIIHTDDFFRPRDPSGKLKLSEFEGNFDLGRFKAEVADCFDSENGFQYGVFNCKKGIITEIKTVPPRSVCVVEGAYCLCPELGDYADVKLFFDVTPDTQKQRILSRNGEEGLNMFLSVWIPAEERYISHYNIQNHCDFVIKEES